MNAVSNPKSIRYHRGKSTEADSWAGEGTGGQDVVVNGCVGWVRVDAGQGLALTAGQVPQSKQMTVETLTCGEKSVLAQTTTKVRGLMEAWWRTCWSAERLPQGWPVHQASRNPPFLVGW